MVEKPLSSRPNLQCCVLDIVHGCQLDCGDELHWTGGWGCALGSLRFSEYLGLNACQAANCARRA